MGSIRQLFTFFNKKHPIFLYGAFPDTYKKNFVRRNQPIPRADCCSPIGSIVIINMFRMHAMRFSNIHQFFYSHSFDPNVLFLPPRSASPVFPHL